MASVERNVVVVKSSEIKKLTEEALNKVQEGLKQIEKIDPSLAGNVYKWARDVFQKVKDDLSCILEVSNSGLTYMLVDRDFKENAVNIVGCSFTVSDIKVMEQYSFEMGYVVELPDYLLLLETSIKDIRDNKKYSSETRFYKLSDSIKNIKDIQDGASNIKYLSSFDVDNEKLVFVEVNKNLALHVKKFMDDKRSNRNRLEEYLCTVKQNILKYLNVLRLKALLN